MAKARATKNRDRGTIGERKVRDRVRAQGIACERTGLMTVAPGERRPDLKVSTLPMGVMGRPVMAEVKTRKGVKWLIDAFEQGEIVFVNTDREEPIACMSMDQFGIFWRNLYFGDDGLPDDTG
jgi:hypothetical protein